MDDIETEFLKTQEMAPLDDITSDDIFFTWPHGRSIYKHFYKNLMTLILT